MGDYMSMQGESSLKFDAPEQRRRYQTRCLAEDENKKKGCLIQFAPSGEDTQCFLTLISRINGAEIRPGLMFPMYVWGVGINLYGANLYGANLYGARYLTVEQVQKANNWEKAIYDEKRKKKLGLD